jgi:hypothetical protein
MYCAEPSGGDRGGEAAAAEIGQRFDTRDASARSNPRAEADRDLSAVVDSAKRRLPIDSFLEQPWKMSPVGCSASVVSRIWRALPSGTSAPKRTTQPARVRPTESLGAGRRAQETGSFVWSIRRAASYLNRTSALDTILASHPWMTQADRRRSVAAHLSTSLRRRAADSLPRPTIALN